MDWDTTDRKRKRESAGRPPAPQVASTRTEKRPVADAGPGSTAIPTSNDLLRGRRHHSSAVKKVETPAPWARTSGHGDAARRTAGLLNQVTSPGPPPAQTRKKALPEDDEVESDAMDREEPTGSRMEGGRENTPSLMQVTGTYPFNDKTERPEKRRKTAGNEMNESDPLRTAPGTFEEPKAPAPSGDQGTLETSEQQKNQARALRKKANKNKTKKELDRMVEERHREMMEQAQRNTKPFSGNSTMRKAAHDESHNRYSELEMPPKASLPDGIDKHSAEADAWHKERVRNILNMRYQHSARFFSGKPMDAGHVQAVKRLHKEWLTHDKTEKSKIEKGNNMLAKQKKRDATKK